jgi:peptidoglycan/xylan/chitin deacetylase (PgdA/CDA1 family)
VYRDLPRSRPAAVLGLALLAGSAALAGCGGHSSARSGTDAGRSATDRSRPAGARGGGAVSEEARRAPHARVPILMYHVIERAPPGTTMPGLWLSPREFRRQVDALAARGYHAVSLGQVWDAWHQGGPLPSKPIVFSFDDGYESQYTNALPVLRSRGWPGVLNLEVATLHDTLRPREVRALIRSGWEVDDHTMTHPDLTKVDSSQLRYEVAGSRAWIRRKFHVPVHFFCYPSGRYDARVIAAVRAAGYLAATTTNPGVAAPSQPRYELPRIRVDSRAAFAGVERRMRAATARSPNAQAVRPINGGGRPADRTKNRRRSGTASPSAR